MGRGLCQENAHPLAGKGVPERQDLAPDSVQTNQWAVSPDAPLLVRAGTVRFYQVYQPWEHIGGLFLTSPVLELWNYHEGKRLSVLDDHGESFQFSPDGRRLAISKSGDINKIGFGDVHRVNGSLVGGSLEIWDVATRQVERVLRPRAADKLTFGPNGRLVLAVNAGEVRLCSTWTPAGRCRPGRSRRETGKHSP